MTLEELLAQKQLEDKLLPPMDDNNADVVSEPMDPQQSGSPTDPTQIPKPMMSNEGMVGAVEGQGGPDVPVNPEEGMGIPQPSLPMQTLQQSSTQEPKTLGREDVMAQLRKKYGLDQDQNKDALKSAQLRSGIATTLGNISAGARQAGMGMAGLPYTPDKEQEARYAAMAKQPMEQYLQKKALGQEGLANESKVQQVAESEQANDPKSQLSVATQHMYAKLLAGSGMTAEQMSDLRGMSASEINQYGKSPMEVAAKLKELLLAKQMQTEALKYKADTSATGKETSSSDKRNEALEKDTRTSLEQMRGNPAVQQAEKDLYSTRKIDSLANLYPDPNNLSKTQVSLLANELGKVASGGVPSAAELAALTPDTYKSQFSGVISTFLNKPTAANAGEFIKQYTDYAKALRKDAQTEIKDRYGRIVNTRKKDFRPEFAKSIEDEYVNRFNKSEPSTQATPIAMVQVKRKSDGAMKSMTTDQAQKLFSSKDSDAYEQVGK